MLISNITAILVSTNKKEKIMSKSDCVRDSDIDRQNDIYATERIVANITVNTLAAEDAAFGRVITGDAAPTERYLKSAGLEHLAPLSDDDADGYIIEKGKIGEYDIDELYFDIYRYNIDRIFADAPKSEWNNEDADKIDICCYTDGLYEYLTEMYDTFKEIMSESAEPVDTYIHAGVNDDEYIKFCRLVSAIGQNKAVCGAPADRYVSDAEDMSALRLTEKRGERYVIKNADRSSTDYKLALFACFKFSDERNASLFTGRLRKWHAHATA